MYEINTLGELLHDLMEMDPAYLEDYSIKEIIEDGLTTGAINPELKPQIWFPKEP